MASGSSSSIMASPGANGSSYDVFLSFRGEDTRDSFTDHLYDALMRAGISTFRDNEEIHRGEELQPEIDRAIKSSRASIVVLSENYATSTWCLDELVLILEQRREWNHFVLPVFYHVDPADVRKQNRNFAIQVKTSRWTDHNVSRWKAALTEVSELAGMVLSGPETKFIKEIINIIHNKLDRKEVHLPSNLTGMEAREKEINYWLKQSDAEFLVICGMGGSGKTTLARYIIYMNWQNFENISIVEDISSRCKEPHEMLKLQENFFGSILGGKRRKIPSVCQGSFTIQEALKTKKALIVLDDITEPSQLVVLLGTRNVNKQSKIIITTRENNPEKWFESGSWRCQKYEMKLLNDAESLELLSRHAFGSKTPMSGFEELAMQAVEYCEGNPLALEVLGSSLFKNNSIPDWKSQLNLLEKDINSRIQSVLIRSYTSLPYDLEKELFLHIACFFVGADMDYVLKILEIDYSALSGIKTLTNRRLLSVTPNKKLTMHRLIQEMGRNIVRQESLKDPLKRSRVWLSSDSYKILSKGKGSETIEGLALDMQMLREEKFAFKTSELKTDALNKMDSLKLLQLNFVELKGSYENFSEDLRWLCWFGFHLTTIPSDLYMGNLVAIDMSCSNLEVFEPPMVLKSLHILNLQDSYNLMEIRSIFLIPNLETLILWNCQSLVRVCETIKGLTSLALLNMTGCKKLYNKEQIKVLVGQQESTSGGFVTEQPTFSFPHSLQRLFLKDCNLECTDSFPLSFSVQPFLQYLNLGNSLFELLPSYDHLDNLRVLDLSLCSRLKYLVCLPSTLAELYIYYCEALEKITFQSHRFMLQEFGYEGCINLTEIEGYIKLVPVAKLDDTDLGHLKWLKEHQYLEVCLFGDDELTVGRSFHVQMLYEFDIMSTSLPDIKDPNMTPEYVSKSLSLSFDVPPCPKNKRLKGLDVTLKYTVCGCDCAWFCKISTINGVDLMYNPKVFGKPEFGEVCIWFSYWPIGNTLVIGDKVHASIAVLSGLVVHECGVSLVYTDDEDGEETMENNMECEEIIGGDLSAFQLSTGAHYLCRQDFYGLMDDGRLTPDWFRILVGDTIDYTEVRGWRKTGRPKYSNLSFTELKTVRCIIHGPELEEIYKIAEISKATFGDKTVTFMSNTLKETEKSATTSHFTHIETEDVDMDEISDDDTSDGKPVIMSAESAKATDLSMDLHELSRFFKEMNEYATSQFSNLTIEGQSESYNLEAIGVASTSDDIMWTPSLSEAGTLESLSTDGTRGQSTEGSQIGEMNTTKLRFVRCPKCLKVLPEPPGVAVYECGGCGTKIKGKKSQNSAIDTTSQRPREYSSEKPIIDQVFGYQEAGSSSNQQSLVDSMSETDQNLFEAQDLFEQPQVASPSLIPMASRGLVHSNFDVYLSFAVFDVGYFGVHLHDAIYRAGLQISPDCHLLPQGGNMQTASIIVLSESYISSSWDLDNLLVVLEQRRISNHFVLPVFFNIESLDITEHGKGFMVRMFQGCWEYMQKVDRWHEALMEVASLPGVNFSGYDNEATVIYEIVSTVKRTLYPSSVSTPLHPTLMDTEDDAK